MSKVKDYKAIIDVETTGLNLNLHEIIQVSIVLFDGNCKPYKNFTSIVQPYNWDVITDEALEINGLTKEELKKAPTGMSVKQDIIRWWRDTTDCHSMIAYGWNYKSFDQAFLKKWFGDDNYSKLIHYRAYDVDEYIHILTDELDLFPELVDQSFKLSNVCNLLSIPLDAHDALHDCRATLDILKEGKNRIKNFKHIK